MTQTYKFKIFMAVFLVLYFLSKSKISFAQKDLDIYSITIGSGHYKQSLEKNLDSLVNLDNVLPACTSAEEFMNFIKSCKSRYNVNIISNENNFITKNQIVDSTSNLLAYAIDNCYKRKRNATFVFYFCGHGLMADSGKSLFLVPGDFECKKNTDFNQLSQSALSINSLFTEAMIKSYSKIKTRNFKVLDFARDNLSFCFLFDCCYNIGKTNSVYIDSLEAFMKEYFPLRLPEIGGLNVTNIANSIAQSLTKTTQENFDRSFFGENLYQYIHLMDNIFVDSLMKIKSIRDFSKHTISVFFAATPGNYAQIGVSGDTLDIQLAPLCGTVIRFTKTRGSFSYGDFLSSLKNYSIDINKKRETPLDKVNRSRMRNR